MSWVITLILLAVAAYFLLNALKGKNQHDMQNQQASLGEVDSSDVVQAGETTSADAFQHAGGMPSAAADNTANGTGSTGGASTTAANAPNNSGGAGSAIGTTTKGAAAVAGAAGVSAAAAIASAREHTLKAVSGNGIGDIQEMIKILNLRDTDSSRLAIDKEQFTALKSGNSSMQTNELTAIADKLRWMLR